jgi:uncharacterized protein YdhG (YjbR/CyaY superfamily)
MQSNANTIEDYMAEVPPERRKVLEKVRRTILDHLPDGYEEVMNWGMITYQVPLERYSDTYNGRPLMYAALASQKQHMALYLSAIYMDEDERGRFEREYRASGKRYDAGKSCVRFRKLEDLPLELIGRSIAAYPVEEFIDRVKLGRRRKS